MNETLDFLLATAGALIFSLFIIYDLQNLIQRTDPGSPSHWPQVHAGIKVEAVGPIA